MRLLPLFVLLIGSTASLAPQEPATDPPFVIDEVLEFRLQQLYVTVTDRRGERVIDLKAEAFRVRDDDAPQQIVTFEGGDLPITAALVVDGSLSMRGAPLRAAQTGVEAFARGMRDLDEASVMVFSDRLLRLTPFTTSADQIVADLRELEAAGGSAVHDHLYLALKLLEQRQGRRVVLLLSDGLDGHSVVSFDRLNRIARVSQSLVYWVRVRESQPVRAAGLTMMSFVGPVRGERDYRSLEKLVKRSGGRIVQIESITDVEWAFREVLAELRQQYAIGYYPTPPHSGSSRFRPVSVELEGRGLKVRAREGYVDR